MFIVESGGPADAAAVTAKGDGFPQAAANAAAPATMTTTPIRRFIRASSLWRVMEQLQGHESQCVGSGHDRRQRARTAQRSFAAAARLFENVSSFVERITSFEISPYT